jgi:L-serine dehydratase
VKAATSAGLSIGQVVLANEAAWEARPGEVAEGLERVWAAFQACIRRGLAHEGELPGGLGMRRRAKDLMQRVEDGRVEPAYSHVARAQAYAFAVNEENAAGGRVVTAPTNGAAGIVPGVLVETAERLGLSRGRIHRALATAGAIGMIIKTHASLSGAEVGCQGEVGSATAMAAAALCEIQGGDVGRVEYAAEIAIEHNLGLTCDPLKGLVQAPCIERNAMGVAKAWSAAQLALHSDGRHVISLDRVIRVMKRTGDDMRREYKETSEGGLAVSLPEC